MSATRRSLWHWPAALLLALTLHGLAAWWFLSNARVQPVPEAAGTSGVVISLASSPLNPAGASPTDIGATKTTNATPPVQPQLEQPTALAAESPRPLLNEEVAQPSLIPNSPLPEVEAEVVLDAAAVALPTLVPSEETAVRPTPVPESKPQPQPAAVPAQSPSEPPIAKTYAIPPEELREIRAAERRRQQAAETRKIQQARAQQAAELQRRQTAEANRQRVLARQKAATRAKPPTSPIIQESIIAASPPNEGKATKQFEGAKSEQTEAEATSTAGNSTNPSSGIADVSATGDSGRGNSEVPDCRDDSDIDGNSNKAEYKTTLQRYLQARQKYPRRAAQRRQQGCVVAQVSINQQGRVTAASLIRKSGHRLLDSAALKLVKPGKKLPTPPATLANMSFKIPFDYRLN